MTRIATLKDNAKIEVHEVTLDWTDGTPKVIEDKVITEEQIDYLNENC